MQDDEVAEPKTRESSTIEETDDTEIGEKGRSCRGCLLYTSSFKETQRNPLCIGLSRSETRVFNMMGESERDATKDGRRLAEFKYACIGYSIHRENRNQSSGPVDRAELPVCVGVEFLADGRPQDENISVPQQSNNDENGPPVVPQAQSSVRAPTTIGGISGDEFASRFFRCAGLVASAVVKNVSVIVGSIKTGLDDIYHERRRPK